MVQSIIDEIYTLKNEEVKSLFFMVYGYMSNKHKKEIEEAIVEMLPYIR